MKEVNELEYQLNAAEEELAMTQDQLSAEMDKQSDLTELQKMMSQTDQAKNQLRVHMRNNLDQFYGPMFARLDLSEEQAEAFKNLIIDFQMAQQEYFQKMDSQGVTPDNRDAVAQGIIEINDEYHNKMEDLFGEEAKAQYLEYRNREGDIQFAHEFSTYLSGTDKLTDEQQEKLVDALCEHRKEFLASLLDEDGTPTYSPDDEESVQNLNIGIMESYLKGADTVLSPSQLERFNFYLNKRVQQLKGLSSQ